MRARFAILATVLFCGCLSVPEASQLEDKTEIPSWHGTLYVGDPSKNAVVRQQSNTVISCGDEKFGEMICMSHPDFMDLALQIRYCRQMAMRNSP